MQEEYLFAKHFSLGMYSWTFSFVSESMMPVISHSEVDKQKKIISAGNIENTE